MVDERILTTCTVYNGKNSVALWFTDHIPIRTRRHWFTSDQLQFIYMSYTSRMQVLMRVVLEVAILFAAR